MKLVTVQSMSRSRQRASILIFALWTLSILSVFAITIGIGVRQKMILVKRLEERSKLFTLTSSGVYKAISILMNEIKSDGHYDRVVKSRLNNNPQSFSSVSWPEGSFEISYSSKEDDGLKKYGVTDEESKINLNHTEENILNRFFKNISGLAEEKAAELARAIIDWTKSGESELEGFVSEDYYSNLEFPYPKKEGNFEILEELLLVKGMTPRILEDLRDYVTIYGSGKININTAQKPVLMALGMEEELANKILFVRQGLDGREATEDDYIFTDINDLINTLSFWVDLEDAERQTLDGLIEQNKLTGQSFFYRIQSRGTVHRAPTFHTDKTESVITCVFNVKSRRIVYWRERLTSL